MKKLLSITLLLCFGLSTSVYGQGNQDNEAIIKKIDAYAKKVQMEWKIPGMSMSIMKDGQLIYAKGFGVKDMTKTEITAAKENYIDENTVFQIGSISKS